MVDVHHGGQRCKSFVSDSINNLDCIEILYCMHYLHNKGITYHTFKHRSW